MDSSSIEVTPTRGTHTQPTSHQPIHPQHRYGNVKWFHAVNSQQTLMEACQEITRTYYGEDLPRRGSMERSSSIASSTGAPDAGGRSPTTSSAGNYALSVPNPTYRVFGIEADVQWHPSMGTAVMRHDPVPAETEGLLAAGSPSSSPENHQEDLFSLEVFLYTFAQAVQGWKSRAASTAAAVPPGPLHVILKLDFKAMKAAQQFLSSAEVHTWAGLETLCLSSTSSRTRRRPSLRSMVPPRLESSAASGIYAAASAANTTSSAAAFAAAPSVHVELWWNADVVAQAGAHVHPLSFAAAPPADVQQLMARTAQALSSRLSFGFSLGWVLSPRVVPPEVLEKAPTRSSTAPVYVAYSEADDVPTMTAFLDGLAAALNGGSTSEKSAEATPVNASAPLNTSSAAPHAVTPPRHSYSGRSSHSNTNSPSAHHHHPSGSHAHSGHLTGQSPPALTSAHLPATHVHLFTFPMLFESVFADVYTEEEKQEAFRTAAAQGPPPQVAGKNGKPIAFHGAVSPASTIAGALKAAESRRVASAVVAHALRLFFASTATTTASATTSARAAGAPQRDSSVTSVPNAGPDSREGSVEPSPTCGAGRTGYEARCFPTFWKAVKPAAARVAVTPTSPASLNSAVGEEEGEKERSASMPAVVATTSPTSFMEEWQADVNRAARELFPYCTIDG